MSGIRDEISSDDPEQLFRVLDVIGQGSFGVVCTCLNTSNDKVYAVKFIEINEDDGENLQNEIDILKATHECDFIVHYHGAYLKENYLMIVMEYCDGGSVLDLVNVLNTGLKEKEIAAICSHCLRGLQYMHSHRIIHRDIKAGNVLLSNDGRAKLADFGVSTKLLTSVQKHRTVVGSPYWMSPEVIVAPNGASGYDYKADIWSLGISAIEMAESKPPHYDINPLRVIFVIPNRAPPVLKEPSKWSQEFCDFITMCLKKNPLDRPTAEQLLRHPFILQVKDQETEIISGLITENQPRMAEWRKKMQNQQQEEDESDDLTGTVKCGTVVKINTKTRTAVEVNADNDSYATVMVNQDNQSPRDEADQYCSVFINS